MQFAASASGIAAFLCLAIPPVAGGAGDEPIASGIGITLSSGTSNPATFAYSLSAGGLWQLTLDLGAARTFAFERDVSGGGTFAFPAPCGARELSFSPFPGEVSRVHTRYRVTGCGHSPILEEADFLVERPLSRLLAIAPAH